MRCGPSYNSLNIHDFINMNFWNLLQRCKAGKFACSAHVLAQVKIHDPFHPFLTAYRHLQGRYRGGTAKAPTPPYWVVCGSERHQHSPCYQRAVWIHTLLSLGCTGVFDLSCRIQSSFSPNFNKNKHCSLSLVIILQKYKISKHSVYQLHQNQSNLSNLQIAICRHYTV